uniref:Uncharacterized protein n=1 Tax=Aegilops tauschii TaxID=37682 RepID=M8AU31_AEGTA
MERLLLDLPSKIQRLLAEQLASFQFQRNCQFYPVMRKKHPSFCLSFYDDDKIAVRNMTAHFFAKENFTSIVLFQVQVIKLYSWSFFDGIHTRYDSIDSTDRGLSWFLPFSRELPWEKVKIDSTSEKAVNKKSYPPSKEEAVHCLEKISLKGKHCAILVENKISTVKHLMRHYHGDESGLQKLTGMKKGAWNTMINHATTCVPGNEIYSYWVPEDKCEIVFNDLYGLVGKMTDDDYVPYSANDVDQFPQHKVKNWKNSAYKKFDERESSGHLTPDYFMINGRPVRAVPHDVGPSVQEFGDRRPLNGYSQAAVLSNNDAGPSNQETLPFSQPTYEQSVHQGLGQHDPCTSQSGTPYYLPQGNFINDQGQGSFSAEPTVPSHIPVPVPEDDQITFTAASLTGQQNGHFSLSTTDAPVTSYPVAGVAGTSSDGVSLGTSSPNHVQTDMLSGLTPIEFQVWLELQARLAAQDFAQVNSVKIRWESKIFLLFHAAELPNSDSQFHGYEHDGGDH